jgi:predicted DNA-binding ribbon-helix-helix protein
MLEEPGEEQVRLVIQLPASIRDEAAQAAEVEDRSLASLIRVLLRQYLDQRRAERSSPRTRRSAH